MLDACLDSLCANIAQAFCDGDPHTRHFGLTDTLRTDALDEYAWGTSHLHQWMVAEFASSRLIIPGATLPELGETAFLYVSLIFRLFQ